MPGFVIFGRVIFAVLFIYAGVAQLLHITETGDLINAHLVIPDALTTYAAQLEDASGMKMGPLLAIVSGGLEVVAGIMIMLNFGVRFFATVLVIYLVVATYFFADFWNQTVMTEKSKLLLDAVKNISLMGALFMVIGYGRGPRPGDKGYSGY